MFVYQSCPSSSSIQKPSKPYQRFKPCGASRLGHGSRRDLSRLGSSGRKFVRDASSRRGAGSRSSEPFWGVAIFIQDSRDGARSFAAPGFAAFDASISSSGPVLQPRRPRRLTAQCHARLRERLGMVLLEVGEELLADADAQVPGA